ncbi:MAG: hypothetical protein L0Y57_12760 [Beijerinckiaceae bacterium]|nr:hypothetical protein [Beijerinckiaceae bacterium]
MWFLITFAILSALYVFIVRPKIKEYHAVSGILDKIDEAGASAWRKFLARLSGYKTVNLAAAAAILPQLPPILDELNNFTGWHLFLDEGTAQKIAAVLAALTAITHVYGLVAAAKIVPVEAWQKED